MFDKITNDWMQKPLHWPCPASFSLFVFSLQKKMFDKITNDCIQTLAHLVSETTALLWLATATF